MVADKCYNERITLKRGSQVLSFIYLILLIFSQSVGFISSHGLENVLFSIYHVISFKRLIVASFEIGAISFLITKHLR